MNSDRLLIFGIPALVAVLVHLLFVFALEGGRTLVREFAFHRLPEYRRKILA